MLLFNYLRAPGAPSMIMKIYPKLMVFNNIVGITTYNSPWPYY